MEQIDQIEGEQSSHLLIDLSSVTFIDSSALAAIVKSMRICRSYGGDLYLSSPTPPVRRIFELTSLDKAINIYTSKSEAIASFNK